MSCIRPQHARTCWRSDTKLTDLCWWCLPSWIWSTGNKLTVLRQPVFVSISMCTRVCVCMCVSVGICLYQCTCVFLSVCLSFSIHSWPWALVYVCLYTCIHTYAFAQVSIHAPDTIHLVNINITSNSLCFVASHLDRDWCKDASHSLTRYTHVWPGSKKSVFFCSFQHTHRAKQAV